jgi:membrane associated rhomboid family serine protease
MSNDPDTIGRRRAERSAREPLFNAPWTIVVLIALLVGAHGLRGAIGLDPAVFAFSSEDIAAGRWAALAGYLFVHGSWAHVLLNSLAVLAFGPPVARLLGSGGRGSLTFALFFLFCGAVAALGYAALHQHERWELIGASGAASGLMGAAARLIDGRGRVGGLFGKTVIAFTVSWTIVNVAFGVFGLTPGAAGVPVAWEAHIVGYFTGLLLIGPFAWLAGAGRVVA